MEEQTKTVLEAFGKVLVAIAEQTAVLMEVRSDLERAAVAANRNTAEELRKSALQAQSMLALL
jgi:hypothetical protein